MKLIAAGCILLICAAPTLAATPRPLPTARPIVVVASRPLGVADFVVNPVCAPTSICAVVSPLAPTARLPDQDG